MFAIMRAHCYCTRLKPPPGSGELGVELSVEAAASVLPASSTLRRLSLQFFKIGSPRVSLLDIFHSLL
jgi:hypothetical protein